VFLNRIFVKLGCACKGDKISSERVGRNNAEKVGGTLLLQVSYFCTNHIISFLRTYSIKLVFVPVNIKIHIYICFLSVNSVWHPTSGETDTYMYISVYPLSLSLHKKLGFISKKFMASLKSHRDFYLVTRHERTLTMMPVFAVRNMGMKTSLWHVYMKFAFIYILLLQTLARLTEVKMYIATQF